MNVPVYIFPITIPLWMLIISGFLMAFVMTGITIPSIVNISRLKGLCVMPNGRTSHNNSTPTLGGIAVFIGLVMSAVIIAGQYFDFELRYIIAGLIIVFFVGIKDDILIIDPMKKLLGQIFASGLIVVLGGIRITSLYGLFYIYDLPHPASILLTVFVLIVIINGFNLIDGIDGLASGVGILTSSIFGIWFLKTGNIAFSIFSFSFIGSLAAFFYFNVFGKKNKIFLGDTGSLLTGFVVGILACRFLQLELLVQGNYIQSSPAVVFGILIVPLFDSLRVFILRIVQGRSPFKADRQHIHHRLLQLGFTHLQATLILIFVNLFFIVLSYLLRGIGIIWLMSVVLGLASLMSYVLVRLTKEKTKEVKNYDNFFIVFWKEANRMKKVIGRNPKKDIILNSTEKISTDIN